MTATAIATIPARNPANRTLPTTTWPSLLAAEPEAASVALPAPAAAPVGATEAVPVGGGVVLPPVSPGPEGVEVAVCEGVPNVGDPERSKLVAIVEKCTAETEEWSSRVSSGSVAAGSNASYDLRDVRADTVEVFHRANVVDASGGARRESRWNLCSDKTSRQGNCDNEEGFHGACLVEGMTEGLSDKYLILIRKASKMNRSAGGWFKSR